jgi:hypothetical protein
MSKPKIQVTYIAWHGKNGLPFRCVKELNDWWDFADWVKQVNLSGKSVILLNWEYSRDRPRRTGKTGV